MSRTIEKTLFTWEKRRGDKCHPGPKSCLPRARPVLGACASEWHKAMRWVSWGTEAGWHVPMPSSRRDGSEGKWTCPPFLTQAKATQASFQCGTEGLSRATLIPQNRLLRKSTTKMLLQQETVWY